jgi:tRNA pseudouridine38-40 synthase
MRYFRATVEYDGTDFAGFQWQKEQRTIQGDLESALNKLTGQFVRVNGAGRTDAGVHAIGQVICFHADTNIPISKFSAALNSVLKKDVCVKAICETDASFHARFSAKSRAYVYLILNREQPSSLLRRYALHYPSTLDIDAMNMGAKSLIGTHDFTSWSNSVKESRSTMRNILQLKVRRVNSMVLLHIEANAFLHGMVRNITGTLLEVGIEKKHPEDIAKITERKDRRYAGPCAPAHGLCLVRVRYIA